MNKIISKIRKNDELILYLFWGVMSVAFNVFTFFILVDCVNVSIIYANTIAFISTILFAYITNTLFVFKEKMTMLNLYKFVGFRILTVFIDNYGVISLMDLGISKLISKLTMNVVIVIINYLLSKFIIYKNK